MHLHKKRTVAAIAALGLATPALLALSTSSADALNGINVTISSNNPASHVIPVDGQGTYFIKHAAVGDVLTFTPATRDPVLGHRPGARRGGPRAACSTAQVFANIGGAVLGTSSRRASVRTSPSRTTLPPRRWLPSASPVALANQAVVDAGLAPVVALADAATQAQYAVAQIQMGNQNPSQAPTVTASNGPPAAR